jgi:D-galactose 1-dehydrogenase
MPFQLAVVGLGKIAVDQHLPAIAATPGLALAATVDPRPVAGGTADFASLDALFASGRQVDAVIVCTPPQVRAAIAMQALDAGRSVLLEKPPAATRAEFEALRTRGDAGGHTLFTAWHSRFAPCVAAAREWLDGREVVAGRIDWREDVRRWHPGQRWLWQAGGLGVFDPGINAFSILTALLQSPVAVLDATLAIPENCDTPIAAALALSAGDARIDVTLDFLQQGQESWDIVLDTRCGHRLQLADGGARMSVDGVATPAAASAEYPALYARFAALLADGASDADATPFALALDALARGTVRRVAAFIE